MLPTGDPLGTVVTMLATPFGRLDGLAIDTAGAGGWRPTGSPPDSPSEGVIDGLPGSVSFPRRKVVVDGPPWGKIVGQRSPDTAIAVAVEDGINHGSHLGLAWPPTGAGRRQEGLQDSPLLACQITGVWLRVHTLSTFETPFWNRLSVQVSGQSSGLFGIEPPKVRVEIRAKGKCVSVPVSASYGFEQATGDVQLRASSTDGKQIEPDTVTLMVNVDQVGQKTVSVSLLDATSGAELASMEKIEVTNII